MRVGHVPSQRFDEIQVQCSPQFVVAITRGLLFFPFNQTPSLDFVTQRSACHAPRGMQGVGSIEIINQLKSIFFASLCAGTESPAVTIPEVR